MWRTSHGVSLVTGLCVSTDAKLTHLGKMQLLRAAHAVQGATRGNQCSYPPGFIDSVLDPSDTFARMPSHRPSPEHYPDFVVYLIEDFLGNHMAMVVRPSP